MNLIEVILMKRKKKPKCIKRNLSQQLLLHLDCKQLTHLTKCIMCFSF